MDEIEHAHEQHRLRLESGLVVLIRDDEEDILQDGDEELIEECIRRRNVGLLRDVVDELQAHIKARSLNLTVIMLAGPQARVDDELELAIVQLEKS